MSAEAIAALPQDAKVDISEEYEVHYWTARLHCSSRELREAVQTVGNRAVDVLAYLRDHADG